MKLGTALESVSFVVLVGLLAGALAGAAPGAPRLHATVQEGAAEEEKGEELPANLRISDDISDDLRRTFEEALEAYEEARDPEKGSTKLMKKAIAKLNKVRRKDSKFPLPYYYLGIGCQLTRDLDDAEKHLKKAIALKPDFHEAMTELGDTYFWLRQWKSALQWYDKAIELEPEYTYAYQRRAATRARDRDFEGSLEDMKMWEKLDPDNEKTIKLYQEMMEKEVQGYDFEPKYTEETEHYIVISNHSQEAVDDMAEQAELIYKLYTSRFPPLDKGADKFPIILFKDRDDYMAYGSPPGSAGYYSPYVRKLVFYYSDKPEDLYMVLRHEAFHQYLHYYLEGAPQWFNEGHGDYFGESRLQPDRKSFQILPNRWRLRTIQGAASRDQHHPLPELLTMTRAQLYDPRTIGLNYAQSWSVVYFMWQFEDGKYFPILKRYFKALQAGKGLQEAYDASFGKTDMDKLEEEWKGFTLSLRGGER